MAINSPTLYSNHSRNMSKPESLPHRNRHHLDEYA
jgi:hypothetical protein